ncbi:MAG: hypothetical protein GVY29_01100 [Spirochaetes bacterium]|jgi:hypothetical protein|nr:hypothetical protein [Spirochaetota bacterium]
MARFSLSQNEELEAEMQPHPVAFADLWAVWTVYLALAVVFMALRTQIGPAIAETGLGSLMGRVMNPALIAALLNVVLFTLVSLSGAIWLAFLRINLWWLVLPLLLGVVLVVITVTAVGAASAGATNQAGASGSAAHPGGPWWLFAIPGGVALLAMSQIELYRRGHRFFITNRRLVFERRYFLAPYTTVEAYYPHITNLVTKQTALERAFGAGTVIPVMSSGLNVGSEVMTMSGGILFFSVSASKEKKKPRALPYMSFYAVRTPHDVAARIGPHITG